MNGLNRMLGRVMILLPLSLQVVGQNQLTPIAVMQQSKPITGEVFIPGKNQVVTASRDATAIIWDLSRVNITMEGVAPHVIATLRQLRVISGIDASESQVVTTSFYEETSVVWNLKRKVFNSHGEITLDVLANINSRSFFEPLKIKISPRRDRVAVLDNRGCIFFYDSDSRGVFKSIDSIDPVYTDDYVYADDDTYNNGENINSVGEGATEFELLGRLCGNDRMADFEFTPDGSKVVALITGNEPSLISWNVYVDQVRNKDGKLTLPVASFNSIKGNVNGYPDFDFEGDKDSIQFLDGSSRVAIRHSPLVSIYDLDDLVLNANGIPECRLFFQVEISDGVVASISTASLGKELAVVSNMADRGTIRIWRVPETAGVTEAEPSITINANRRVVDIELDALGHYLAEAGTNVTSLAEAGTNVTSQQFPVNLYQLSVTDTGGRNSSRNSSQVNNTGSYNLVAQLPHEQNLTRILFADDNQKLMSTSGNTSKVWSLSEYTEFVASDALTNTGMVSAVMAGVINTILFVYFQ